MDEEKKDNSAEPAADASEKKELEIESEIKRDQEDYVDLTRSEAQNHYRTEALKEENKKAVKQHVAVNKVTDFFESKFFTWFYHYFRSRFGKKSKFQNYDSGADNGVYKLEKTSSPDDPCIKIALVSDWATDTKEADDIAVLIESREPDYTIHLGDTYFVGMKTEINDNFLSDNSSWYRGTSGSFSLLGNHEMYSRGISYFRDLLPTLGVFSREQNKYAGQKASYFCLENEYWRIISLDTGYNSVGIPLIEYLFPPKCQFEKGIIDWLQNTLDLKNDKRGLFFLTHHQYCSAFEDEFYKPAEQLAEIIGKERNVLWFWGHEHRLSVYGKFRSDNGVTAYGRCIGHGGMPVEFKLKVKPERIVPRNLVLYDERKYTQIEKTDIGYNGFVMLSLDSSELTAEYTDIKNNLIMKEIWTADNSTGEIKGKEIKLISKDPDIKVTAQDINRAIN